MGTQDINFMADRLRKMATDGDGYFAQDDIRRLFAAADSMAEAADELSRLRAEVERLREALEPFSEMAGELFARNFNAKDVVIRLRHRPFVDGEFRRELTFWHFVCARKALEGGNERTVSKR